MRILVFAGTDEGKRLCEYLADFTAQVTASVATAYGARCLSHIQGLELWEGRLTLAEMKERVKVFDLIVDATHPFAALCTENIQVACESARREYLRLLRPAENAADCIGFSDIDSLCAYLAQTTGNVLLTTGSKALASYTRIPNYAQRLFPRVLPVADSLAACLNHGFSPGNIICMQGPFSQALNLAMLKAVKAKYLVTKEAGKTGGFTEKLVAAHQAGVQVLVIGRPAEEKGMSLSAVKAYLQPRLQWKPVAAGRFPLFVSLQGRRVLVVGAGAVAARRVVSLLPFGPLITVVAPVFTASLAQSAVTLLQESFEEKHLTGADYVIAATDSAAVNQRVCAGAKKLGVPVNCADDRDSCDFFFPALFSAGDIVGGLVSKSGRAHALVKEAAREIRICLKRGKTDEED